MGEFVSIVPIALATLCAILTHSRFLLIQIGTEIPINVGDIGGRHVMPTKLNHTRILSKESLNLLETIFGQSGRHHLRRQGKSSVVLFIGLLCNYITEQIDYNNKI